MTARIRPARLDDAAQIVDLVRELAAYEQAADQATLTARKLGEDMFGDNPAIHALVVESPDVDDELAGVGLYFLSYSTWLGQQGIFLEDLYVRERFRGRGYGRALLAALARHCVENGFGRLDWAVLDWNTPSRDFYAAHGAHARTDWIPYRLSGAALTELAAQASD